MGGGPCQLHPGTRVICLGCFLPDLTSVNRVALRENQQSPPLRALRTNAQAHYHCCPG